MRARQLFARLFEMIPVKMQIAKSVNEFTARQAADLRHHHGEERIARDVEGHAEKKIGAALVKLATERAVLDVKLKKRVAGRQRHRLDFGRIPGGDDEAATVGVLFDLFDDTLDLVDVFAVRPAPVAPLRAVDAAEVALLVGPFVPDADAAFLQISDVGVAAQKPEQLVNDRLEVQLLGREKGKRFAQIEAGLGAENGKGPGAGAIVLRAPFLEDEPEEDRDIPASA